MDLRVKYAAMRTGLPLLELRDQLRLEYWPPARDAWPATGPLNSVVAPFFIIGSPRSGTTLLRAIIQGHSEIFIPPENGTLGSMVREFSLLRRKSWEQVVDTLLDEFACGYEFSHWQLQLDELRERAMKLEPDRRSLAGLIEIIYQVYGEKYAAGKPRWGDKSTPGSFHYLYRLSRVFPEARYLHIVRDGRACVASSLKAGFFDRDHLHAALAWQFNVRSANRLGGQLDDPSRFLEIRYEDLIAQPGPTVAAICEFLGVTLEPALLAHSEQIGSRIPEITDVEHHRNVGQPLFSDSLEKWRDEIPMDTLRSIQQSIKPDLARLGYL